MPGRTPRMPDDDFLEGYLARIGLARRPAADLAGLVAVHRAQAERIPFENLDPLLGLPVPLEAEALAAKLIARRRGGYCFELNALLQRALVALGFAVEAMTGRVHFGRPAPGARTHHLLRVRLEGRTWLADAAFTGWGIREPMPLEPGREEVQGCDSYRLQPREGFGLVLQRRAPDGSWGDLYSFVPEPALAVDLVMGNHFTATYPPSPFRRMLVCGRASAAGRVSIVDRELALEDAAGRRSVRRLETPAEAVAALAHLGLEPDPGLAVAVAARLAEAWAAA